MTGSRSEKLWTLRLGYTDVAVGSLSKVQAAQRALAALTMVDVRYERVGGETERFVVESEESAACERFEGKVITQQQFARERIRKIELKTAK